MEFPNLTPEQRKQVLMQWKHQQHQTHTVDISLSPHGDVLKDFLVYKGVWNPAITSARYHASYLFFNNERLFRDKRVLDMGCGTGIMGIVMGLYGADEVIMTDISEKAVKNSRENVRRFGLEKKAKVLQGDLFQHVKGTFDFIIFNQPFFQGYAPPRDTIFASMLAPPYLIENFLEAADEFLEGPPFSGGLSNEFANDITASRIAMPFYRKAASEGACSNDPSVQGTNHRYTVVPVFKTISKTGLQRGEISMYELFNRSH